MQVRAAVSVAVVSLVAATLSAHETWIAPTQTAVLPGAMVRLDLSSSGVFPLMETAILPGRLSRASVRLADLNEKLTPGAGSKSLKFSFVTPKDKEGFATVFVSLKPKTLTLERALIAEYAQEIGQPELLAHWNARAEPKQWRESYAKHTKAFFRVGKAEDESWKTPVGQALEIVPLTDPTRSTVADDFNLQVLRDGQPLSDFPVVAILDSRTPRVFGRTDMEGKAMFRLERPGRWLFAATVVRESIKPNLDYESDFATALVMIRPVAVFSATPSPSPTK
jgi:uncharacterized GH25 family protein